MYLEIMSRCLKYISSRVDLTYRQKKYHIETLLKENVKAISPLDFHLTS